MAIFGPKPWVNRIRRIAIFRLFDFFSTCSYSLERCFFALEYRKRHCPGLYWLKQKFGKMAILGPKPWVNPFGRMSIFRLFELFSTCFYSVERRFFALENRKRLFPGLYCLKKKLGEMAIFGPKSWVNLFSKMSFFRLFELLVFIAYKGVFSL